MYEPYYLQQRRYLRHYIDGPAQTDTICRKTRKFVVFVVDTANFLFWDEGEHVVDTTMVDFLDATVRMGDEALQQQMLDAHHVSEISYMHRYHIWFTLVANNAANPIGDPMHTVVSGSGGCGKTECVQRVARQCVPGLIQEVTKESKCAPFSNDKSLSTLIGVKLWNETPATYFAKFIGNEVGDDDVEQIKTQLSEGRWKVRTAYCVKNAQGHIMRGVSELHQLDQHTQILCCNAANTRDQMRHRTSGSP